jgi:hypothetical protein
MVMRTSVDNPTCPAVTLAGIVSARFNPASGLSSAFAGMARSHDYAARKTKRDVIDGGCMGSLDAP